MSLRIRILLPLVKSSGSNLKLKEVTRDEGQLGWVLDKEGETLTSTFGREDSSSPHMRSFLLLLLGNLKGECLKPLRMMPLAL